MMKSLVLLSAICGITSAHFQLNYPESIGFDDDKEGTGPCGGFEPDFSNSSQLVDFHVGGDSIAVTLTHTQGNWLFRVTTDEKAESGWEQVFPIVQQKGIGNFCEPKITIPSNYTGKNGVLSVVSDAGDGLLYQCAAVKFVDGSVDPPSNCANGSSVQASFVDDSKLSALIGNDSSPSPTASSSTTGTQSSSTSTTTHNGAASYQAWSTTAVGWQSGLTVLCMATLGGAFLV